MPTKDDEQKLAGTRMSFGQHLDELRSRLFKALLVSLLGLVMVFIWHREVMNFVLEPFRSVMADLNQDPTLKTTGPAQAFFSYVKVSFVVGLVCTAPLWIYQIWAFIAAGMYSNERYVVHKYVPFCVVLFLIGITFGYTTLIPLGLRYLLTFGDPTVIQNWIGLKEYLGLFTVLTLVLGVTFQLPVIMIGMARSGVVGPDAFRRKRKWMILSIFIAGAILTPPDPVTQCLLAFPLIGLYEFGIYLSWLALGADRPPIAWAEAKPRLKKVAIVLAIVAIVWTPMSNAWNVQRAQDRLYQSDDENRLDMPRFAEQLLNKTVRAAYRASEVGREAIVVCDTAEKVYVLKARKIRRKAVIVDRMGTDPEGIRTTVSYNIAGQALFDIILLYEVGYADFVPQMLDDFERGDEAVCGALRPMLQKLSKKGEGLDDDRALEAWRKWSDAHASDKLVQREGN
ncbi:MAG: twin-arginine translocase subunit TatC [Planctomycetes bacterium]|nr:twin-arginine translocase subunit TatC [Planctomycetota bacterium]